MTATNETKWRAICAEKGVLDLFEHYLNCAEKAHGASVQFNSKMSVAIHKGKPVISLHPLKSIAGKGLWIGYSRTNIGRHPLPKSLPVGFEMHELIQGNNEWRFGFFNTCEAIDKLIEDVF